MKEPAEKVILVHGIWMTGIELQLLRRRIAAMGFDCHLFRYASLRQTPAQNADRLNALVTQLNTLCVHFVAHSLGGIVLLHLFDRYPDQPPGRVVMLGTPVCGSAVARRLAGMPLFHRSLGRSVKRGLLGDVPAWAGGRELGVVAGTQAMGVGCLIGGLAQPSDGAVAVSETRLRNAQGHLLLPVSHTGLVFSRRVAKAVGRFLRTGRFD